MSTNSSPATASSVDPRPLAKIKPRSRAACNDCRARKIKCDGLKPCRACRRADRDCYYDGTHQKRPSKDVYIIELQREIKRLKDLLDDRRPENERERSTSRTREDPVSHRPTADGLSPQTLPENGSLETMIDAVGRLHVDDSGHSRYRGHYAGLTLLERIRETCSQLQPGVSGKATAQLPANIAHTFDLPHLSCLKWPVVEDVFAFLPDGATARHLTAVALEDACCIMSFVHRPSFDRTLDRLYTLDKSQYTEADLNFLPLLFGALAVGKLFVLGGCYAGSEESIECLKYFESSRALFEVTECDDLQILQAILFLIMYLEASGRLSAAHSYLSVASAAALNMGIHRATAPASIDSVTLDMRKRTFWCLWVMDTYLTAMLGLPRTIPGLCYDQMLPLEHAEDHISSHQRWQETMPIDPKMVLMNRHIRLMQIMSEVVDSVYPIRNLQLQKDKEYLHIEPSTIDKIEKALDDWYSHLQSGNDLAGVVEPDHVRAQLRLRMAYAHVQMVMYRPFLHHIIKRGARTAVELRSYACASACVKAAMQVIWIVEQLYNHGFHTVPYWLTVYMAFFSSLTLVMFTLSNADDPTVDHAWDAIIRARLLFLKLSHSSPRAKECAAALEGFVRKHDPTKLPGVEVAMLSRETEPSLTTANAATNSIEMLESAFSTRLNSSGSTRPQISEDIDLDRSPGALQRGNDGNFRSADGSTLQARAYSAISSGYSSASSPFDASYNLELGDMWNADTKKVAENVNSQN